MLSLNSLKVCWVKTHTATCWYRTGKRGISPGETQSPCQPRPQGSPPQWGFSPPAFCILSPRRPQQSPNPPPPSFWASCSGCTRHRAAVRAHYFALIPWDPQSNFWVLFLLYRKSEFLATRACSLTAWFQSTNHFFSGRLLNATHTTTGTPSDFPCIKKHKIVPDRKNTKTLFYEWKSRTRFRKNTQWSPSLWFRWLFFPSCSDISSTVTRMFSKYLHGLSSANYKDWQNAYSITLKTILNTLHSQHVAAYRILWKLSF